MGAVESPKRIQLRRTKGWRKPEGVISVVRGTDWGNPWRVGDPLPGADIDIDAPLAVALFAAWVRARPGIEDQIRHELGGSDLACWCPIGQPCHADLLLEIANPPAPAECCCWWGPARSGQREAPEYVCIHCAHHQGGTEVCGKPSCPGA